MLGSKPLVFEMPWERYEKLSEILLGLEWSTTGGDYRSYCPVCAEPKDKGHDDDCQLKALIDTWNDG